jgi:hypothetical protein
MLDSSDALQSSIDGKNNSAYKYRTFFKQIGGFFMVQYSLKVLILLQNPIIYMASLLKNGHVEKNGFLQNSVNFCAQNSKNVNRYFIHMIIFGFAIIISSFIIFLIRETKHNFKTETLLFSIVSC